MSHYYTKFVLIFFLCLQFACKEDIKKSTPAPPSAPTPTPTPPVDGQSIVNLSTSFQKLLGDGFKATKIVATISNSSSSIEKEMLLKDGLASVTFDKLNSGDYSLEVDAFQYETLIYKGSQTFNVIVQDSKNVQIDLEFAQIRPATGEKIYGVVPADYVAGKYFGSLWSGDQPLKSLRENNLSWVRAGVTTQQSSDLAADPSAWKSLQWKNEFWSSVEWTEQIFNEAKSLGMRLNLFLYLSETSAFSWKQDAPKAWANLSIEETAKVLEDYSYNIAAYYKNKGYDVELYDIGNEIGFGVLNFVPNQRIPLPTGIDVLNNMDYMVNQIWKPEAILLKGAIAGIKKADPDAKIVLHIAELAVSKDDIFPRTFFETMYLEKVEFDYAGLSYPYRFESGQTIDDHYFKNKTLAGTLNFIGALGKKAIFSEFSFPHREDGIGQPAPADYPYTSTGQAQWLNDFLTILTANENVKGSYYFYPEHFPGSNYSPVPNLESSGLFQNSTTILPAMEVYKKF